jgi:hypothetical protein
VYKDEGFHEPQAGRDDHVIDGGGRVIQRLVGLGDFFKKLVQGWRMYCGGGVWPTRSRSVERKEGRGVGVRRRGLKTREVKR